MRYSMLVYLVKMSKTLLEAAQYLRTAPENDPLRPELLENGWQMIGQIRSELKRHQKDLRSKLPKEYMETVAAMWGSDEAELEETLQGFAECLPREVHYQVRVVFFAELGEKWDSMESVYWLMRKDPRFDPVVVLTPVFRQVQQEDGQVKQEVIYKDYLTPMGIPFLEYDKYKPEKDCPDLAFICQPYEGVTPREFWPITIAQYTRLVYLSYFLLDYALKDHMTSLAQMPVYSYAWKVTCPTEKQYRYYCEHSVHGGTNAIVTGIPKLDGLVNLQKDGIARPKNWDCLEGKTVFLWNTWYSLNISSLRDYFGLIIPWFREHQDCALIWRPHPMTKTVTKLYFPDQYQKLLDNIRFADSSPNVILDRETSFKAAFYYSDAMISDESSMVPQYLLMDKPTLMIRPGSWSPPDTFIEESWKECAESWAGILGFLERVRAGKDLKAEIRREIRQRDLPLADGHCAERICETLWTEMHREDLGL